MAEETLRSERAEAIEVKRTCRSSNVLHRACRSCESALVSKTPSTSTTGDRALGCPRTFWAEASAIVHAFQHPHTLVDVKVHALVSVAAEAVLAKEPAFRHRPQLVLVQELARPALLAEPSEPMLADRLAMLSRSRRARHEVEAGGRRVAKGTGGAERTRRIGRRAFEMEAMFGTKLSVAVELDALLGLEVAFDVELGVSKVGVRDD